MPVYNGSIDNIVGVLYVKDLLSIMRLGEPVVLEKLIRPTYFVPETKKINRLLKQFQRRHLHMAIATDEFGGVSGIVTIEDIIEELVGEIQDEYDEEVPLVEMVADFEYKVSAAAPISDANDFLPYPLPEGEDYETVGGLVSVLYGQIPEDITDSINFNEYEVRVLEKSERSLISVLFKIKEEFREDTIVREMPEH